MDVCVLSKHSNTELRTKPLQLFSHPQNESGYKGISILGITSINQNKRLYFSV